MKKLTADRLEVIDEYGRAFVRHNIDVLEMELQDDGRTVKLFVNRDYTGQFQEFNPGGTD